MGKIYVEKNMPKKKRKLHRAVGILLAVAVKITAAIPFIIRDCSGSFYKNIDF